MDSYHDVLVKAARGLQIECDLDDISLICSGGLVANQCIDDNIWTLGEFVKLNGGVTTRSKKTWGIYIPIDVDDQDDRIDSVRRLVCSCMHAYYD